MSYSPWDRKESGTTGATHTHRHERDSPSGFTCAASRGVHRAVAGLLP